MNIKEKVRKKVKDFLGISAIEKHLQNSISRDLVREVEARAYSTSAEFIEKHMTKAKALSSNFDVIDFAMGKIQANQKGLICEFGVFQGESLNHIARKTKSKVHGFDSFKGL